MNYFTRRLGGNKEMMSRPSSRVTPTNPLMDPYRYVPKARFLSTWLMAWSILFFVSRGRIPSPFVANIAVVLVVVVGHASVDQRWRRFLFAVLVHVFPLILTLPPRLTATDGVTNLVVLTTYFLFIHLTGSNFLEVYGQYKANLDVCA